MGLALPAESASLWNTIHREAVAVAAGRLVKAIILMSFDPKVL